MRLSCPGLRSVLVWSSLSCLWTGSLACRSVSPKKVEGDVPAAGAPSTLRGERTFRLGEERRFSYRADCRGHDDCEIAFIPVDCCGSHRALGVRAGARRRLLREVEQSTPFRSSCECLASRTRLDDGSELPDESEVAVHCMKGLCMTEPSPPR